MSTSRAFNFFGRLRMYRRSESFSSKTTVGLDRRSHQVMKEEDGGQLAMVRPQERGWLTSAVVAVELCMMWETIADVR